MSPYFFKTQCSMYWNTKEEERTETFQNHTHNLTKTLNAWCHWRKEQLPCTWDLVVFILFKRLIFVNHITKTNSRQYEISCFFLFQRTCHLCCPWHPLVHLSLTTLYISHHDHPWLRGVTESTCTIQGKRINQHNNAPFHSTWNTIITNRLPFDVSSPAVLAIDKLNWPKQNIWNY